MQYQFFQGLSPGWVGGLGAGNTCREGIQGEKQADGDLLLLGSLLREFGLFGLEGARG